MKLSDFGKKFTGGAGILSLMDDLGNALADAEGKEVIMMGGGNPAHIPRIEQLARERLEAILADEYQFRHLIGIYDPPKGNRPFVDGLAELYRKAYGWPVTAANICLTNGSQAAFFILFNMFAGRFAGEPGRQVVMPMAPEYIGYTDTGLTEDFFVTTRPSLQFLDANTFKYRVDFNALELNERAGLVCVSRPTNPTGNVLTDEELARLDAMARSRGIPLLIDCAYGPPFPDMIYTEATPLWNDNVILCQSLSKFGLPAARTGIVIASEEVIQALSSVNAILNLATSSFGSLLTLDLVTSGEILRVSDEIIRPFYERQVMEALAIVQDCLRSIPYFVHQPEGAMFLWLWFPGLPISSLALYERLKARGVIVVSGHYFFPGIEDDWQHKRECIRVTCCQDAAVTRRGMEIIAEEVGKAFSRRA